MVPLPLRQIPAARNSTSKPEQLKSRAASKPPSSQGRKCFNMGIRRPCGEFGHLKAKIVAPAKNFASR
jgi:hypothetical protein